MRRHVLLLIMLSLGLVLVGCSKPGSEYLGKWQDSSRPNSDIVEITRNGENYLVQRTTPGGRFRPVTESAVLKDGRLLVGPEMLGLNYTYVKNSDTLLVPQALGPALEMKRIK